MKIKDDIPAFSEATKITYENWDALVAAESNGYVAVAIMLSSKDVWAWTVGPFATKAEATKQAAKMRREAKKDANPQLLVKVRVRPLWKADR